MGIAAGNPIAAPVQPLPFLGDYNVMIQEVYSFTATVEQLAPVQPAYNGDGVALSFSGAFDSVIGDG